MRTFTADRHQERSLSEAFYEGREMPVSDRSGGICTCEKGWNDFSKSHKLSCRKTTACIS